MNRIIQYFEWLASNVWQLISALFLAALAYFADLKGAIHVMWIAFILDLILGIITSKVIYNERFLISRAFIMLERMLISTLVILLLFAVDMETHQDILHIYNLVAWMISSMLIYSILDNGDKLTGRKFFGIFKTFLGNKIKEQTGMDPNTQNNG